MQWTTYIRFAREKYERDKKKFTAKEALGFLETVDATIKRTSYDTWVHSPSRVTPRISKAIEAAASTYMRTHLLPGMHAPLWTQVPTETALDASLVPLPITATNPTIPARSPTPNFTGKDAEEHTKTASGSEEGPPSLMSTPTLSRQVIFAESAASVTGADETPDLVLSKRSQSCPSASRLVSAFVPIPDEGWAKPDWRKALHIVERDSRLHKHMLTLVRDESFRKMSPAYVYIMRDPRNVGVKVGVATNPLKRLSDLSTGAPGLQLVLCFKSGHAYSVENLVHKIGRIIEPENPRPPVPEGDKQTKNEWLFLTPMEASVCIQYAMMVIHDVARNMFPDFGVAAGDDACVSTSEDACKNL